MRHGPGTRRRSPGWLVVGRYLGIGIANMIVVVNPDVVVIGGGISAAFDLLHGPIEAELRERVLHDGARSRPSRAGGARDVGRRHRGGPPRRRNG